VLSDGSYEPLTTLSKGQAILFSGTFANLDRSVALMAIPGNGGTTYGVVDAETGAPIALEHPLVQGGWAAFSPNGEWLASVDPTAGVIRLIDTTTWTTQRTVPMLNGCCLRWSADGDELVLGATYTAEGTDLPIVSPGNPSADRTITVAGEYCGSVNEWGPTDRIIVSCTAKLVTLSAVDGSDVRLLAQTGCPGGSSPCVTYDETGGQARFSPSGSHIVTVERVDPTDPWNQSAPTRVVIMEDAASAALTPLTSATFPGPGLGMWR
jgi:hypothetical protein